MEKLELELAQAKLHSKGKRPGAVLGEDECSEHSDNGEDGEQVYGDNGEGDGTSDSSESISNG